VRTPLNSLFCRHNRFTADCAICSKGTLLEKGSRPVPARSKPSGGSTRSRTSSSTSTGARVVRGPYASAGPYQREDGSRYEVRLERVPGGLRLGQWSGGALEKAAPVLGAADVLILVSAARERSLLPERDLEPLERALSSSVSGEPADVAASPGRAGDMREELRVEAGSDGMVRVARWLYRPNQGWELQQAPVMLPAKRYADAFGRAVKAGLLLPASASGAADPGGAAAPPAPAPFPPAR
jgi:hypothetical protein